MAGYNNNYGGANIYVDISDLQETIKKMKDVMSRGAFEEMLRCTFNDAGRKVKTIVSREVPQDYEVTASWVRNSVGWPKRLPSTQIGVEIPINGHRGSIGGRYRATRATGGKIRARIVKNQTTILPDNMPAHLGGQPPFMVRKDNNDRMVFTRMYKGKPYPIVRVVGLGVPQMPINKSRDDVQDEIRTVVEKRLVHHFGRLWGK